MSIEVRGNNPAWTNTNIQVTSSDHLQFSSTGQISRYMTHLMAGPEGISSMPTNSKFVAPQLTAYALIGRIGANGTPFFIGASLDMTAASSGLLYLIYNDEKYSDNNGSFTVNVTQTHAGITIISAIYGFESETADVTNLLQNLVNTGAREINVENDILGEDPSYGNLKKLTVKYSIGGKEMTAIAEEHQVLYFSDSSSITITSAIYGYQSATADVTSVVQDLVNGGTRMIRVENNVLGGDPSYGNTKVLTITYNTGRGEITKSAEEHQTITL